MAKFEEGLERVMSVTGALEHERPFLAPLCKFMTIHPRHSVQAVAFVRCFLPAVPCRPGRAEATLPARGADLSVGSSPESRCTGVSRAHRNRWLASVSLAGRLVGPVVVSVVQSGAEARKLVVGV